MVVMCKRTTARRCFGIWRFELLHGRRRQQRDVVRITRFQALERGEFREGYLGAVDDPEKSIPHGNPLAHRPPIMSRIWPI